ncbi:S8 family serine peptidase [Pseudoalteromonas luteoviolacea]|uniref:S8 family serine peptidase n=1 Tax=Pseudoalteromonas luteoviolacea TaxID=43657 RepID=UPI001EEEBB83|nr:S8 family serine peptidase [Pseudoalteromonas luteoviolacea]MCF6440946.1 S8 family serine peptidase [Pseudoalteromonas luteoviolacea]
MAKYSFKATAVAIAVSGALSAASVNAATLEKNARSVNTQVAKVDVSKKQENRVNAFLVVLKQDTAADLMIRGNYSASDARATHVSIDAAQQEVTQQLVDEIADVKIIGSTKVLASTLIVEASAEALAKIKKNKNVERVLPLRDYELHVAEANEYIKAAPVNLSGYTGEGQKVAVLDTGLDYTHKVFGGAGTVEAYEAAQSDPRAVTWPQGQVIGGYDFVRNDPDPIENDPNFPDPTSPDDDASSHGTSVSHSVTGIAPDVELYAYSVCGGGCSFAAQLGALEAAMDPNGDGDISDRVDVINMSLGGEFGSTVTSEMDGTQYLIHKFVKLGTNVVISAGNDGNNPFRIGGPSTTPNALSVGAMGHPTINDLFAVGTVAGNRVEVGTAGFGFQGEFAFSNEDVELVYPEAAPEGCLVEDQNNPGETLNPFAGMDFTGKAVLIDRGSCAFTEKALNAQEQGAAYVIIANNGPGEAPGLGGSNPAVTIPTISVQQAVGTQIKDILAADQQPEFNFSIESHLAIDTVADFSSRGPSMDGLLKPEITAPGVNIQVAATGTQDQLAGATGTSFSGPITAGAVALVREARPELTAEEIKAVLMNTANLNVIMEPTTVSAESVLAPISLIGAGLVDVEKAVASEAVAWVAQEEFDTNQGALSFGFDVLDETTSYTKTVTLKNFSAEAKTYNLRKEARYANDDDDDKTALSWDYPAEVTVPAGQTIEFDVTMTIDPSKLHGWNLPNPQSYEDQKARPTALTLSEYDGALIFDDTSTDGDHDIHLVYHVLPRAAEAVEFSYDDSNRLMVTNTGFSDLNVTTDQIVATGTDNDDDKPFAIESVSFNVYGSDGCAADPWTSGVWFTASIQLQDDLLMHRQAGYRMTLDINEDGIDDFFLQNYNDVGRSADVIGRGRTLSGPIVDGADQWRYATAMYHQSGSDTITFSGCADIIGLDMSNLGNNIRIETSVGYDNYQTGISTVTDTLTGMVAFGTSSAQLVDAEGNPVMTLAEGETAYVSADAPFVLSHDFRIISAVTAQDLAGPTEPEATTPEIVEASFDVAENTETGTVFGQIELVEQDGTVDISEFLVRSSNHAGVTVSKAGELVVADGDLLDYEAGYMATLVVVAIDVKGNISDEAEIAVNITNEIDTDEEKAPYIAEGQEFDVQENAEEGTVIGQLEFMDQDDNVVEFKVEGTDAIEIDADGKITVVGEVDFDAGETIEATVVAVDADDLESEAMTVVFNVEEDEYEGKPMIEEGQSFNIEENSPIGTVIGQLTFSDFDNDVVEFMVSGSALVSVNEQGQVLVAGNLDFEFDRHFSFDVKAKDAQGKHSDTVRVEIRLIDVDEDNGDDDDSGSLAWLTLLAAPFAALRRRKQK